MQTRYQVKRQKIKVTRQKGKRRAGKVKVKVKGLLFTFFDLFYLCLMECRENCGACCIAISISSPIPGMPEGKPAGVRCMHLLENYQCAIYYESGKPQVCTDFKAEPEFCGNSREEALKILFSLSK